MRTKWEILQDRANVLQEQLNEALAYMNGLAHTPCKLTCEGCGTFLATEKDFAAHFEIPDERYLNLGNCPKGSRYDRNDLTNLKNNL